MDARRALAIAFVAVATLGILGGLGAAAFGQLDEDQHQREANPAADRTERNARVHLLGVVAGMASVPLLGMGLAGFWARGDPRARAPITWASVVAVAAILFVALGMDSLSTSDQEFPVQVDVFTGSLPETVALGPLGSLQTGEGHSDQIFLAPANAARVVVAVIWDPAGQARENLVAVLEVDPGTGWREEGRAQGPPPLHLEAAPADLGNASVRLRILAPEDIGTAEEQPFRAEVAFWR